jgi:AraC-like DNA-binding protein
MVRATTFSQPMLSAAYIRLLADVVLRWGISVDTLLEGSGLNAYALLQPDLRVEAPLFVSLSQKAIRLTGEAGLSVHMGLQMKVTCHGIIGIAALMAKNLGEAIEIACQYMNLLSSFVAWRLEIEDEHAVVYIDEIMPRYPLTDFGLLFMVVGCVTMSEAITGQVLTGYADIRITKPDFFERFASQLSGTIHFDQPLNRIVFSKSYLDLPLVMADPTSARMAREQCKKELCSLAGQAGVAGIVRELAFDEVAGFCSIEDVAKALCMSERTLQRQLVAAGTSYSQILDELRHQKALQLLKDRNLCLKTVSNQLGYTNVTNLTRAFKRWTGMSPTAFRESISST